jgi:hypothetical protein
MENEKTISARPGSPSGRFAPSFLLAVSPAPNLRQTTENIVGLKSQQRLLPGMLRQVARGKPPPTVDVKLWVKMLRAAGMDEDGMHRWHSEFERRAPEGHQEFLRSLGLPPHGVEEARRLGPSPLPSVSDLRRSVE